MRFSKNLKSLLFLFSLTWLASCGDADEEANLVNLHAAANLDLIAVEFSANTNEPIISISSTVDFTLQGTKSNGIDVIDVTSQARWSVSDNALSSIDQSGRLTAGTTPETITVTAEVGHLKDTFEVKVSNAKFDKILQLNSSSFNINMCLSQTLKPIARYVDDEGNDEIRSADNNVLNKLEWVIRDQEDNAISKRAFINTQDNIAKFRTLTAGPVLIQASARSDFSGNIETSDIFTQTINNNLSSIKFCLANDTDLTNCTLSSLTVDEDQTRSVIAVGTYSDTGSFINISENTKWGIETAANATLSINNDTSQLDIKGIVENTTTNIYGACGDIVEPISSIDITQGVILSSSISCGSNLNCQLSNITLTVDELDVESLEVTANDIDLVSNTTTTFNSAPSEIELDVKANFTNDSDTNITDDSDLEYIIDADSTSIVEKKSGSDGVFDVLSSGTATITLTYRSQQFIVVLQIP